MEIKATSIGITTLRVLAGIFGMTCELKPSIADTLRSWISAPVNPAEMKKRTIK